MYEGSNFPISSLKFVIFHFLNYEHLSAYEVVFHCGFGCYFSNKDLITLSQGKFTSGGSTIFHSFLLPETEYLLGWASPAQSPSVLKSIPSWSDRAFVKQHSTEAGSEGRIERTKVDSH